jgi:hypothetical protein
MERMILRQLAWVLPSFLSAPLLSLQPDIVAPDTTEKRVPIEYQMPAQKTEQIPTVGPEAAGPENSDQARLEAEREKSLQEYKQRIISWKQEGKEIAKAQHEHELQVVTHNQDVDKFHKDVEEFSSQITAYQSLNKQQEINRKTFDEKYKSYLDELSKWKEEADGYAEKLSQYKEQIATYEGQVTVYNQAVQDYQAQTADYQQKLDDYKEGPFDRKQGVYESLVALKNSLEERFNTLTKIESDLKKTADDLNLLKLQLDTEYLKLDAHGKVLEKLNGYWKVKKENLDKTAADLEDKRSELTPIGLDLNKKQADLNKQADLLDRNLEEINKRKADWKAQGKEFEDLLNQEEEMDLIPNPPKTQPGESISDKKSLEKPLLEPASDVPATQPIESTLSVPVKESEESVPSVSVTQPASQPVEPDLNIPTIEQAKPAPNKQDLQDQKDKGL